MEKFLINPNQKISTINKDIYGHFSEHLGRCIYEGIFVGENSKIPNLNGMRCDVVNALKELNIPVLRWPGGCFADEYHWRDGIGKKSDRKKMINTHWGGLVEDNSFGTHEFFELCRQLNCDVYINGNVGSGTVQEMSEWVEYMTFSGVSPMAQLRRQNGQDEPWRVKYFGIGNENWGCGGNMSPEFYGEMFMQYQTYVRNYDNDKPIYRVACGPNSFDFNWTHKVMEKTIRKIDGLALHYYTMPAKDRVKNCGRGPATGFDDVAYYETLYKALRIDELITRHCEIMNLYDPEKKVDLIVDEWGTWYDVEPGTNPGFLYQQNTMRDAIVAASTLNVFNKHSSRVKMANIAQMVNVLQAVILTDADDMLLTPTYHVFNMYKAHQNNTLIGSYITTNTTGLEEYNVPVLHESVSIDKDGTIVATLCNTSINESKEVSCQIADFKLTSVEAQVLNAPHTAFNTFENKTNVSTKEFTSYKKTTDGFVANIPACSVIKFVIK